MSTNMVCTPPTPLQALKPDILMSRFQKMVLNIIPMLHLLLVASLGLRPPPPALHAFTTEENTFALCLLIYFLICNFHCTLIGTELAFSYYFRIMTFFFCI